MSIPFCEKSQEDISYSFQKVGDGFTNLFQKNPENKILVDNLCSGLVGLAFQCQKNKHISETKGGLQTIKR